MQNLMGRIRRCAEDYNMICGRRRVSNAFSAIFAARIRIFI